MYPDYYLLRPVQENVSEEYPLILSVSLTATTNSDRSLIYQQICLDPSYYLTRIM